MNDLNNFTSFYTIYNNAQFASELEAAMNSSNSNNSRLETLKKIIEAKKDQLQALANQVKKITNLLGSEQANGLLTTIDTNINCLDKLNKDIDAMLVKVTPDFVTLLTDDARLYQDNAKMLEDMIAKTEDKYQESITSALQLGVVTVDDLDSLKKLPDLPLSLKNIIDEVIKPVTDKRAIEAQNLAEQPAIEDEKGKESNRALIASNPENKLAARLNEIKYHEDMNYSSEVAAVKIQATKEELDRKISELKSKEKLSFKEAITLQSLVIEVENLNEMLYNATLDNRLLKGEVKLAKTNAKIKNKAQSLDDMEKQESYDSALFRFASALKEQSLAMKLAKLQSKMVVIQNKQRASTLLTFDKKNNRLIKKAKREATKRVIASKTKENIDRLREFKNQILMEAKNVKSDFHRFVHRLELLNDLSDKAIFLVGASEVSLLPVLDNSQDRVTMKM